MLYVQFSHCTKTNRSCCIISIRYITELQGSSNREKLRSFLNTLLEGKIQLSTD